jgi:hypothetical protein
MEDFRYKGSRKVGLASDCYIICGILHYEYKSKWKHDPIRNYGVGACVVDCA